MLGKDLIISASVVLYNTQDNYLYDILNCVINSSISKLYIVDNSPKDTSRKIVEEFNTDKFYYIFGHGNIGFGAANNIALEKVINEGFKYHIVLNPDIIFEPYVISELITIANNNSEIGQILPKVIYPDGRLQYLCKLYPTPFDIFARRLLPNGWYKKRNERYEMHFTGYDKVWNCPMLSGCFMFLNLAIIKQVGLFDTRFFMYFEDNDLTRRIHDVSMTIYYPHVTIIHNHAAEHRHNKQLLKIGFISAIRYFNKWGWFFDIRRHKANKLALKSEVQL